MNRRTLQASRRAQRSLAVVAVAVALAGPASAQAPRVEFDGSEIFCHILKHFKFEPIPSIDDLPNYAPDETLIVAFGSLQPLQTLLQPPPAETPEAKRKFDDYAFLLASDYPTGRRARSRDARSLLERWNLLVVDAQVWQHRVDAYHGIPRCVLLTPADLSQQHPLFRGIDKGIATNRASYLVSDGSDLHVLATMPRSRRVDWFGLGMAGDVGDADYIYGTKGNHDQRILILAGHGVFLNGMLVQDDIDNGLFAVNTVRWLRDGPSGNRKYALMVHNGEVVTNFDLPLTKPPAAPLPPSTVVNRMLRELENERFFHRFLEEVVGWPNILRFVLLAGTLGLFVYGVARLFPARHRQEAVPLVVGMVPPPRRGRPLLEQRQIELLAQDNLWEPAQTLARQWFLDHAGVAAPWWDEADGVAPPPAHYRAGWWGRQKLAGQVRGVWAIAIADPSRRVSLDEFRRLTEMLQALHHAVQSGQVTFAGGRTTPER